MDRRTSRALSAVVSAVLITLTAVVALPQEASAAVLVSTSSLNAGSLRVEGPGAAVNATVRVTSPESTASGRADGKGVFKVAASGYRSSTCKVTVADGATSVVATLSGCTPTSPPPGPAPSSLSLTPPTLDFVGNLVIGEVLLASPAASPVVVTLTSSDPARAALNASSVTVAAGTNQGVFTVTQLVAVAAPTVVTISATSGGVTKQATVTINPTPPVGISPSGPLGPGFVGSDFTTFATLGTTITMGPHAVGPARFAVVAGSLPAGLSLRDLNTSQTPAKHIGISIVGVPTTAGTSTFSIRGTDVNGNIATGTYSITVNSARTLVINPQLPWSPVVGAFSNLWLDGSGGSQPYTWTRTAGVFPTGMSLLQDVPGSALVRITGTPTAAGSFTFTLRVADAAGASTTITLTVVVS